MGGWWRRLCNLSQRRKGSGSSYRSLRLCERSSPRLHQDRLQRRRVGRLDEMVVEPRLSRTSAVLVLVVTCHGDQEQLAAGVLAPQAAGDLVAVDARQSDVEQHHIRPEGLCGGDRGGAVVGGADVVALQAQEE